MFGTLSVHKCEVQHAWRGRGGGGGGGGGAVLTQRWGRHRSPLLFLWGKWWGTAGSSPSGWQTGPWAGNDRLQSGNQRQEKRLSQMGQPTDFFSFFFIYLYVFRIVMCGVLFGLVDSKTEPHKPSKEAPCHKWSSSRANSLFKFWQLLTVKCYIRWKYSSYRIANIKIFGCTKIMIIDTLTSFQLKMKYMSNICQFILWRKVRFQSYIFGRGMFNNHILLNKQNIRFNNLDGVKVERDNSPKI